MLSCEAPASAKRTTLNYKLFFCSEYTTILNMLDEPVAGYRPLVAGCPAASVIIVEYTAQLSGRCSQTFWEHGLF
jgi:hypothetical protein